MFPRTARALSTISLLSLSLVLIGCGGDDAATDSADSQPKMKPRSAETAVQPVAVQAAQTSGAQPASAAQTPTPRGPAAAPALPPGVDPSDVFLLSDAGNAFTVAADPVERATFYVAARPTENAPSGAFRVDTRRPLPGTNRPKVTSAYSPRTESTTPRAAAGTIPKGFQELTAFGRTDDGLPLRLQNEKDGSEYVLIPGGTAIRGTNDGPEDARPRHTVELDPYYMAVHEVTVEQYTKFREAMKDDRERRPPANAVNADGDPQMPALGVSNRDAQAYAEWIGGSLPTEAQWEKAARGTEGYPYPWGRERPVWVGPRTPQDIGPVMSVRTDVSPYGIHDLAGNAREWCLDIYRNNAYLQAGDHGEKLLQNPTGPRGSGTANERVIRGNGPDWKAWHRSSGRLTESLPDVGFRCVVNLSPASEESPGRTGEQPPRRTGF